MILVLKNAVAEARGGCLAVEAEHGSWRLCVSGGRAALEASLDGAELPVDPQVPLHPSAALRVLLDVLSSVADPEWGGGPPLRVAVVGPPGSGKSTLVRRLLGLPPPAGPTRGPEAHRAVVLGREAEIVDLPGGAPAPEDAGCTVVVAPLDVYEEPPPARGRAVLVGSRADLGRRGLLELYAARLRPAAALALDLRRAPRWELARAVAACASFNPP
ncbi:MAG: 50S ribosome-binding GTPase [Thermoproteaceae archaeon]|nr:50S ribosome-binding GTPase [Thermoproteaceae archaeon]